jgi:hypothetical protein
MYFDKKKQLDSYHVVLSFTPKEGINTVMTVRDFSQIWDAYTEFEYGLISLQLQKMKEHENSTGYEFVDDAVKTK